uniref:Nacetylglucosamine1phosphotransferase subunits alpha/beta putative n=1 Tax=Albugo laibachii Nc14 TaxID=890382 RepID=F0WXD4_9STRA|nr:Nacetylglucosamine1phosphotransferase subunits alpha/beta putative [Albugo laibachii Nc14]|eukprot:CCA26126.1 Nacetylglucosamine1phosphotransferase subunits alpha/beta putative [Albugo laibachii Nc14]
MLEMKSHWPQEFEATSSHRFRHPHDVQFGFSYNYYVVNRRKLHPPTIEEIWAEDIDANRNGVLDHLEILTVASMADGVTTSGTSIQLIIDCFAPPHPLNVTEKNTKDGNRQVSETLYPILTLDSLKKCKNVTEKLIENVRRKKTYQLMFEGEVTFIMLNEDPAESRKQILKLRARPTKFICINDDLNKPLIKHHQLLQGLFQEFWPNRSQFELPRHVRNRYLHIHILAQQQVHKIYLGLFLIVVVLVPFICCVWRDSIRIVGNHIVNRTRACSAYILKRERIKADKNVVHKSSIWASSPRASRKGDPDIIANKTE